MSMPLIIKRLNVLDKFKEFLDYKFKPEGKNHSFSKLKRHIYYGEIINDFIDDLEIFGFSPFRGQIFSAQCRNPDIQKFTNKKFNEGLINYVKRKNNNALERNYSNYLKFKILEIKNKYKNKYEIKKPVSQIKKFKYNKFFQELGKIRKEQLLEKKEDLEKENTFESFCDTNSVLKNQSRKDSNILSTKTSVINSISSTANISNSMKDISFVNLYNTAKKFKINLKKIREDQINIKHNKTNLLFSPNKSKEKKKKKQKHYLIVSNKETKTNKDNDKKNSNNNKYSNLNKKQILDLLRKKIEESPSSLFGKANKIKKFKRNYSSPSFI